MTGTLGLPLGLLALAHGFQTICCGSLLCGQSIESEQRIFHKIVTRILRNTQHERYYIYFTINIMKAICDIIIYLQDRKSCDLLCIYWIVFTGLKSRDFRIVRLIIICKINLAAIGHA